MNRNHYFPLFLPGGTQGSGTYGWYVIYAYASSPDDIDGFHVSDVQPIGPWPSYYDTLALCDVLNEEAVDHDRVLTQG